MVIRKFVTLVFAASLVAFTKCRAQHKNYTEDGIAAEKNEFPFAAVLGWPIIHNADAVVTYSPICGGSVISKYHVLTAGQCVAQFAKSYKKNSMVAVLGAFDRRIMMPEELRIPVESIDLHPYYIGNPAYINDLAVVTLSDKIMFNYGIRPVCLPHPKFNTSKRQVTVSGWGQEKFGELAVFQRKLVTAVMPVSLCQHYWRVTHGNLCTFSQSGSFCREESGGPIVLDDNSWLILVGVQTVVSCLTDKPVVNAAVSPYVKWIQEVVNKTRPAPVCIK